GGAASGGASAAATPSASEPTPSAPAPEVPPAQQAGVVDFNAQYAASHTGAPINWGNVVLGVSLAALVIGGAAFVVWRERGLRGQIPSPKSQTPKQETSVVSQQSSVGNDRSSVSDPPGLRPEVAELLPALQALEPRALKALKKILAEPSPGSELLIALSHIDPMLIEQVRRLDRRELNLLMALAGEG
ncbi:MAG: hypothetical protein HY023_07055, partial [Chloroflexi bacterium]|nr:hypothetical protein [Chloroflexota bacterium]